MTNSMQNPISLPAVKKSAAAEAESCIRVLRGERVILDSDLAELYGVETRALVQAVRRNLDRFPSDFAFQLSKEEVDNLRSQSVTSSWGGRRYPPFAFTEQGVAMLSSVLRSERAINVNIEIMRAFVRLRLLLSENASLSRRLNDIERKYDTQFKLVFDVLKQLTAPQPSNRPPRRIGFTHEKNPDK
jgi:hypothetical protein